MNVNTILNFSDTTKKYIENMPFKEPLDDVVYNFKENKKGYIMDMKNLSLFKETKYHDYKLKNYLEEMKKLTVKSIQRNRSLTPKNIIELTLGLQQAINLTIIYSSWLMSKQVFEPSQELCDSILTMVPDKVEEAKSYILYKNILEHLPYDTFILDLSNVSLPFDTSTMYKIYLASFVTTDNDDLLMSLIPIESCIEDDNFGLPSLLHFGGEDHSLELVINDDVVGAYKDGRDAKYINFILNLITYLSAINSDIRPSTETRYSYKPSRRIRNVYTEIQKWEVGWTYAEAIKLHEEKMNIRKGKRGVVLENDDDDDEDLVYKRKPHVRRAHWCRYHCGPGRKMLEVKWIDTIWVHGKYQSDFIVTGRPQGDQTKELEKR